MYMRSVIFALVFCAAIGSAQRQLVPVPDDPHEFANKPARVLTTAEDRGAFMSILNRAAVSFAFHPRAGAPYSFKVAFTAAGGWSDQGQGQVEETWANGQQWRWSANLGGYSQLRIFSKGIAYDDKQSGMPMPVLMLRSAIFNPVHSASANMQMRAVSTTLNGAEVSCGLFTTGSVEPADTPRRRWAESEYCVDPRSNLLMIASDSPGEYVVYDYSAAIQFHGRTIPSGLSIYENGAKVVDARLSIADTDANNMAVFTPTQQMISGGPGAIMTAPERIIRLFPTSAAGSDERVQPTIVHVTIDQNGNVSEAVALQTSSVSGQALQAVKQTNFGNLSRPGQPGIQRQAFVNVQFVPLGAGSARGSLQHLH